MARTRVAINGFGRIGRSAFKIAWERSDLEVVAINDIADIETLAYLLKHDTIYGQYGHKVVAKDGHLVVNNIPVKVYNQPDVSKINWGDNQVDVVIESTGLSTDYGDAYKHINSGAKRVLLTAPFYNNDNPGTTLVLGVNDDALPEANEVISVPGCSINSAAIVASVVDKKFGIENLMLNSIRSYTSAQRLVDMPTTDLRLSRSGADNIIPNNENLVSGLVNVLPNLKNKVSALEINVPAQAVSMIDFVVRLKDKVSVANVNKVLQEAARDPFYQGILSITNEKLVSSDFKGDSSSAVVDLGLTQIIDDNTLRLVVWFDNEWGYTNRLVEIAADIMRVGK